MEIWNKLLNRMIRASRMDSSLYEEMETDEEALGQAVMIALLASAATGIGMALAGLIGGAGLLWPLWGLLVVFSHRSPDGLSGFSNLLSRHNLPRRPKR